MPSSVALRRTFLVSLLLVLIAAPLAPQVGAYVAEGPAPPSVTVVHDADALPATAAAILQEVTWEGGYDGIRLQRAGGAEAFRDAVRDADTHVVILIAHGDSEGLHIGGTIISWPDVARDLRASGARDAILLACGSAAIGNVEGIRLLKVYDDRVDLEVAALDAAHVLGSTHLTNARLLRFSDAHTAYMMRNGGPMRYLGLMIAPERTLDMTACQQTWGNWRSSSYSGNPYHYSCQSPMYLRPNPSCTWSNVNCQGFTSQHQKELEKSIEEHSSANVQWGGSVDLMDGLLEFKLGSNVGDTEYEIYFNFGGEGDKPGTPIYRGIKIQGTCYQLLDIADFAAPALRAIEEAIDKLPQTRATIDGIALYVCASIEGGIVARPNEPVTKGHFTGRVDFRVSSGVTIAVDLWFCTCWVEAEMNLSYPLDATFDLENRKTDRVLRVTVSFEYGPFEFEIKENLFHSYWSVEIPVFSGKSDAKSFDIDYSRFFPGTAGADGATATQSTIAPGPTPEALSRLLAQLPPGVEVVATPEEVAYAVENGQATPLVDLLELKAGDALLNRFQQSGALADLGVDASTLRPSDSLVFDLADPLVHEALYGGTAPRQRTLLGLPGGVMLATVPCQSTSVGSLVAVHLGDCDPVRSVAGLSVGADADPTLLGLRPTADAKRAVAETALQAQAVVGNTVCVGAAIVRSPTTGHAYTADEVCRWLAYGSGAGEAETVVATAYESHAQKIALVTEGLVGWLTDACSMEAARLLRDQRVTDLCLTFRALPSGVDSRGEKVGTLSSADVLVELETGMDRISRFAHGEQPGNSVFVLDRQVWAANEPIGTATGEELAFLGDPLGAAISLAKRAECTLTRMIQPSPDCQNVEPLL